MSEWQTPQYLMSMTTSASRGSRRSNEKGTMGVLADSAAKPLAWIMVVTFKGVVREVRVAETTLAACLEKPHIPSCDMKERFTMTKDQLDGLLALKLVADRRSFTAAASALRISPSAISQIIKQ